MFFLVFAIVISAMVMHVAMKVSGVQQTVVLFVLGVLASLIIKGANLEDSLGPTGRSYSMWMTIDPHLLLFTLLPPLLQQSPQLLRVLRPNAPTKGHRVHQQIASLRIRQD